VHHFGDAIRSPAVDVPQSRADDDHVWVVSITNLRKKGYTV
jgi:hypothetical protein